MAHVPGLNEEQEQEIIALTDEINEIINNYEQMIQGNNYDESILKEAIVYNEIYKQNNRINCAMLPWKGLKKIINEISKK